MGWSVSLCRFHWPRSVTRGERAFSTTNVFYILIMIRFFNCIPSLFLNEKQLARPTWNLNSLLQVYQTRQRQKMSEHWNFDTLIIIDTVWHSKKLRGLKIVEKRRSVNEFYIQWRLFQFLVGVFHRRPACLRTSTKPYNPNGPEASREAGWRSESVPLKKC